MKIKTLGHVDPHTHEGCQTVQTSRAVACCNAMADSQLYPYVHNGRVWAYFREAESGDNVGAPLVYCPWCGTPINEDPLP